jgi:REP element-mobilizing transposase RayT
LEYGSDMPRKARIDAPGALHHIIVRGIERKVIFRDLRDYQNFAERLGNILEETGTPCFAWSLMKNHAHLLLRTGHAPLSTVMRRLLTGYAQQFNRRHQRHGHVFQNRYKSILCEEDPYLLELVRYIHLNPLRGSMVKDLKALNTYLHTGHSALMGKVKRDWQDTEYVLRQFGQTVRVARRAYSDFILKGINHGRRPELVGGGLIRSVGGWSAVKEFRSANVRVISDERILGSSDFAESVLKQANEKFEKKTLAKAKGLDLDGLISVVAGNFEIVPEIIKSESKQRTGSRARAIICYLASVRLAISGAQLARKLQLTPSAVSKLISRGRQDKLSSEIDSHVFNLKKLKK